MVVNKLYFYPLLLVSMAVSLLACSSDSVTGPAANSAPVADAGADSCVVTGLEVVLDGSGSSDSNSDPLEYQWLLDSKPATSSAVLSNPTLVDASFTPDLDGIYAAKLVVNDGEFDSAPDWVTFTASVTGNCVPVANAGDDQNVVTGVQVDLDGSGSYDTDGAIASYQWVIETQPSAVTLSNSTAVDPSFIPDANGDYTISLVVSDGADDSAADTVTITASDTIPIADAGEVQNVVTGSTVTLDGSASFDPQGGTVTYLWAIDSQPGTATLSNVTAESPTFVADADGIYTISLVVNDGTFNSAPDTVVVTATTAPTGSFLAGQVKFAADCGGACHDAGTYYTEGSRSDLCGDGDLMIPNLSGYSGQMSGMTLTDKEILDLKAFLDDPSIAPCN